MKKNIICALALCFSLSIATAQTGSINDPFNELYVNNFIKIGMNSLFLSSTNSGTENSIYTTNGDLRINAAEGQGTQFNTLLNPQRSNVGIGLFNPLGKLDINLGDDYHTKEAGVRITVPNAVLTDGSNDNTNESIFEIRKDISGNLAGPIYDTQFILNHQGRVGIGEQNPNSKLHVHNGRIQITGNNSYGGPMMVFGGDTNAPNGHWGIEYISGGIAGLNFWKPSGSNNSGNYKMFISDEGKVSIGLDPNNPNNFPTATFSDQYDLFVGTGILTEKLTVALRSSDSWADYVFEEDYQLLPLSEVEKHIEEKGHLPNVPSAEDIVQSGINVAQMDAKLLEKIEELTLYVIAQNKRLEKQQKQIEELEHKLKK
jgi:hypothetical protein